MDKIVEVLLEFIGVEDQEKQTYLAICQMLEQNSQIPVKIYHKRAYFWQAYVQFLQGKISPEEFLATGDMSSTVPIVKEDNLSSLEFLVQKKRKKLTEKTVLLVDEKSYLILSTAQKKEVQKELEKTNSLLLLC